MDLPIYDSSKLNPGEKRLVKELKAIHEVCSGNEFIRYEILDESYALRPPRKYRIHYHLKSFIGIDDAKNPIVGEQHIVDLEIPIKYPLESVVPYARTQIWHPNIKWDGPYKGHICGNVRDFGKTYTLDLMIMRIAQILEFKNYLAENVPPFPEEEKVAKWVREYAEPVGFLNPDPRTGILWDQIPEGIVELPTATTSEGPVMGQAEPEPKVPEKKIRISIKGGKKTPPPGQNEPIRPQQPPIKKSIISIKPKS